MHFLLNTLKVFETSWYNSQPTQSPLDEANSFFASYSSLYAPLSQSVPISHNVTNPILWSSFLLHIIQLTSLALKLAPGHPSRWPDWILSCVSAFSGQGASAEHIHDFLAIVAEEMANADLLGPSKYVITFLLILAFIVCSYLFPYTRLQIRQSMMDATTMVVQAITACISQPLGAVPSTHCQSALRCLQTWMSFLRTE